MIILSYWSTHNFRYILPEYFGSINISLFNFFTILTTDSWCGELLYKLRYKANNNGIFIVIFVILGSFVLLNIMTAIACLYMTKISRKNSN